MDCSLTGSSVHGILQARILEWIAISFFQRIFPTLGLNLGPLLGRRILWMNSGIRWWTGRPGVLRFMGSQRVRHDWATELNWTECNLGSPEFISLNRYCMGINKDRKFYCCNRKHLYRLERPFLYQFLFLLETLGDRRDKGRHVVPSPSFTEGKGIQTEQPGCSRSHNLWMTWLSLEFRNSHSYSQPLLIALWNFIHLWVLLTMNNTWQLAPISLVWRWNFCNTFFYSLPIPFPLFTQLTGRIT